MVDVYLSPSTQEHNACVLGDREEDHANKVVDAMLPYLKASGVTYARNDRYKMTHTEAARDSNRVGCKIHYALHTNANTSRLAVHGERCYRNPLKPAAVKAAQTLIDWQRKIYRDPAGCSVNSPVVHYTEIYGIKAPIAIIDEIGYHTNRDDMVWVHGKPKEIAKNKVQAICQILGKAFVDPDVTAPKPPAPPAPPKPAATVYTVQRGDSLSKIAKRFGVKWLDIAKKNNIKLPYIIRAGQKLVIPK